MLAADKPHQTQASPGPPGDILPVARYRVEATVQKPVLLPDFAGSMLRGVFGHALRALVCVTGKPTCEGCPLRGRCDYSLLFDPPPISGDRRHVTPPAPMWVEPPPIGAQRLRRDDPLNFGFVLFGPARARLGVVAAAWQRALLLPLGKSRGSASLDAIRTETGVLVWRHNAIQSQEAGERSPVPPAVPRSVRVRLLTPVSIRARGVHLGPGNFTSLQFLRALARRVVDLRQLVLHERCTLDVPAMLRQAATWHDNLDIGFQSWQRYSNRQQRPMRMGGVIGTLELAGDMSAWWPWLYWGQWLHVGHKAGFGLGRYELQTMEEPLP